MAVARLAVLGSPIAHSRSPALHAAAYRVLGLDWSYGSADVAEWDLPAFLGGLGSEWRGLSLTMPLKRAVLPLVAGHDELVDRLGLANTVLLGEHPALFNTDVGGIDAVLRPFGTPGRAVVLGAGATAASALEALRLLGAAERIVAARDPDSARRRLRDLATAAVPLAEAPLSTADMVIATLPGGVDAGVAVPARIAGAVLLDVAYAPWPSRLGADWSAAGGVLLHGLDMLVEQAVLQVRVFVSGDLARPLAREPEVRAAMRAAVVGPAGREGPAAPRSGGVGRPVVGPAEREGPAAPRSGGVGRPVVGPAGGKGPAVPGSGGVGRPVVGPAGREGPAAPWSGGVGRPVGG